MSVRDQLKSDQALAFWRDLAPHAKKGAVFIVEKALDLVDVGVAMAENNAAQVEAWIIESTLRRPTPDEHQIWDATPGTYFDMLIVEPFVLIQENERPPAIVEAEPQEATIEEIARFAARQKPD